MTTEEAKQLKPGDRVLVEAEVTCAVTGYPRTHHVTSRGNVALKTPIISDPPMAHWMVAPEAIREKLKPFYEPEPTTYRKFKALDIVFAHDGYWIVGVDESEDGTVVVGMPGAIKRYKHKDLKLICAAENREDRKGKS